MEGDRGKALVWDGRPEWYEAWYVTVSRRFWFRHSLHVHEGRAEWAHWLAAFEGVPVARRRTGARGDVAAGEVDGARWELDLTPLAPPFEVVHPLLRPLAKTKLILPAPAVRVDGVVEVDGIRHEVRDEVGTLGHVFGTRHADRWGWAHATHHDGRWVELLAAKVPRLPQVASFATETSRRSALRVRGVVGPGELRVGPYAVEADPAGLVGVTYHDPDGSPVYCYHSETARLQGPGGAAVAAFEYGSRRPLADVPLLV